MAWHQVVVAAAPGDAVTNAAFEYRAILRERSASELFAHFIHDDLAGEVRPLRELPPASMGDGCLFHVSIGDDATCAAVESWTGSLAISYHNITPAEHFTGIDPDFAVQLAAGRAQLRRLVPRVDLALADSSFNAEELAAIGYRNVHVCPLVVDTKRLVGQTPDDAVASRLGAREGPTVLYVGQLLPHKRPDLLIAAFHILVTYLMPEAHLELVGAHRSGAYGAAIEHFVAELGLESVHLAGTVTDAELAAYYRHADLFVTASEHEGFGIPPLEAMAFDVPVIARAAAAIPETVGDGGLLLPAQRGPQLLAEAMHAVLTDTRLGSALRAAGRQRLRLFEPAAARDAFRGLMAR